MTGWCRLWHEMPSDPKWRVIARKSGRSISEVIAVFTFAMVNASQSVTERGVTHGLDAEDIAAALDISAEDVEAILAAMQGKVLEGDRLTGWEKRQPKREDSSAARTRQYRHRRHNASHDECDAPEQSRTDSDKEDSLTSLVNGNGAEAPPAKAMKEKTGKRAHPLPEQFEPTPQDNDEGLKLGLVEDDLDREFDKFRDWAAATGSLKKNWNAAWRNWLREAAARKARNGKAQGHGISARR